MMSAVTKCAVALLGAAGLAEGFYLYERAAERRTLNSGAAPRQEEQESLLGKYLEDWFLIGMQVSVIRSDLKITDTEVIVSFKIPGLKADTLKIAVNDVQVSAAYSVGAVVEKRDARGVYRGETARQFQLVMPVPPVADASKHRIIFEEDGFLIIFAKREDPALKS